MVSSLPAIRTPSAPRSAPTSHRGSHQFFSPSSMKHHPLFQTTSMASYSHPTPPTRSHGVTISLSKFSTGFQGGNYIDSGLGSLRRNEELKERTKIRKQQSMVERARMKQELLKLDELKRQRRYKLRELKRRQLLRESTSCITIQRYYRGYLLRSTLAIEMFIRETKAVNCIVRAYRTYCIVRIAKADRGVLDRIKMEDKAAKILQSYMIRYKLRKGALSRIGELRIIRFKERSEYIRQLQSNAACYIQRIFRGIIDRNKVIKMAVLQQVEQAQGRVGEDEDEEEKLIPELVNKRKNRYQLKR
ncbi:hypothetical protein TL16_g07056 [Triparma laevis f. inornata]|uniref:Uncharacterized protein n=1 Tax=Triparma laevis f. inornata TaxID=1714386 RepID=A0A9W7ART8_9STRA|nr:hypothetical protein TL16_g07056 [Triparma laevis f. inornata]